MQLTLREIRRIYTRPRRLAGMAVIAAILGIAGPFGTFETMSTGARLAYWGAIVFCTYAVGVFFAGFFMGLLPRRPGNAPARILISGLIAGIPVTLTVAAIDLLAAGPGPLRLSGILTLWGYCTLIALGVAVVSNMMEREQGAQVTPPQPGAAQARPTVDAAQPPAAPAPAAILSRLPIEARGPLVSMSMQDHYVEVVTTRGKALVLMRLSDAIRETEGVEGLQIHRSHWVALAGVASVKRHDGKLIVETTKGAELPVSRTFADAVRDAGLLPRS